MKIPFLFTSFVIIILFTGCKSNNNEKDRSYVSDSTSITSLTGDSVKLKKTASINFKVKDAMQGAKAVSQITHRLGGIVSHQHIESLENQTKELKVSDDSLLIISSFTPQAEITVQVPAENLEEFMYTVAGLGYFISSSKIDIDDKSLDYLTFQLKQKNRQEFLAFPVNKKQLDSARLLRIDIGDNAIDKEIAKRQINAEVKYSTVQLSLFQNPLVRKEIISNYSINDYRLSFVKSMINGLNAGWGYFLDFILVIIHCWVFILIALAAWLILKSYQYKRKSIEYACQK